MHRRLAGDAAGKDGQRYVATEHLLLGLVREPGRAEAILEGCGVPLEVIRKKVMETLGRSHG